MKFASLCQASYRNTTVFPYCVTAKFNYSNANAIAYESSQDVVVCFRGSDDWKDHIYSSKCWPVKFKHLGKVHAGYYDQLSCLLDTSFQSYLDSIKKPFYIIGHSLGGALALLLSLTQYQRSNFLACVTFAAPKCVDKKIILNTLGLIHWRYTTSNDVVTKLFLGYKHTVVSRPLSRRGHSIKNFI